MKFLIAMSLLTVSLSSFANILGTYRLDKEIAVMSETEESCLQSQGRWEEDVCLLPTSDEAKVSKARAGYKLHVSTISTNYHTCEFEGKARLENNTLISNVVTEQYDFASDKMVEVTCEVKATIKNDVMDIETNDNCRTFCGANGWLAVGGLKKVK